MKVNIFRIPAAEMAALRARLVKAGLEIVQEPTFSEWTASFYYSTTPTPTPIPWATTFEAYFSHDELPRNLNYFATLLMSKGENHYALSYGKSHFYIRPYCDYDFGVELAKRIAEPKETRQTAAKRFAGKRTRDIRSYASNTPLMIEPGESLDYIQATISEDLRQTFGKSGRFGASVQVNPDITLEELGDFLDAVQLRAALPARFPFPRTVVVTGEEEIAKLDELLLDELYREEAVADFANNSIDLYGVDFVFPSEGTFTLKLGRSASESLEELTMGHLKRFIRANHVKREDALKIRVHHQREGDPSFSRPIKEEVDFIADGERVVLSNGRWLRFNEDYLAALDEAVRGIEVEEVEDDLRVISQNEGDFNTSEAVAAAGFSVGDKDFSILRTRASIAVEAWDLRRENTVYAVKFGTAQKLNYACDQALNVIELLANKAELEAVPTFSRYCLWFGYRTKSKPLTSLADSGSIILKQKVAAWARQTRLSGYTPVIRLSRYVKPAATGD